MSIKLIGQVYKIIDLKGGPKFLLVTLAKYANDKGVSCYPSISTLESDCGMTRPTIINHLNFLKEKNYIAWERYGSRYNTNSYRILVKNFNYSKESLLVKKLNYSDPEFKALVKYFNYASKESLLALVKNLNPNRHLNSQLKVNFPNNGNEPKKDRLDDHSDKDKKERKPNPVWDLAVIISKLTGLDMNIKRNKGRQLKIAKELNDAGYTVEDVKVFGRWWFKHDWRGKQKQLPTPEQVLSEISKPVKRNEILTDNNKSEFDINKLKEEARKELTNE